VARAAAAADPTDVSAAISVADLDIAGGHIDDAFDRLLVLFPACDPEAKDRLRGHLVALFSVVGDADARVIAARSRLTNLLF
jgi:putative thioredoxin